MMTPIWGLLQKLCDRSAISDPVTEIVTSWSTLNNDLEG
jgi:hypothetical protein